MLTLNRPERLNAYTPKMMAELSDVISGGQRGCRRSRRSSSPAPVAGLRRRRHRWRVRREARLARSRSPKPPRPTNDAPPLWQRLGCVSPRSSKATRRRDHGPAIGVGLTMVLPFDSPGSPLSGAKLSARFVKMGLVPELASSHFLVTRCGWGNASYLALSGATVARRGGPGGLGLVDRVVPAEQVGLYRAGGGPRVRRQPVAAAADDQGAPQPERLGHRLHRGTAP